MDARGSLIGDLERAIASGTLERRVASLWHVTDLFITGASHYSDEQVSLFDDVITRLAAQIEVTARAKLARLLARMGNLSQVLLNRVFGRQVVPHQVRQSQYNR